jgi:hypothetical protein
MARRLAHREAHAVPNLGWRFGTHGFLRPHLQLWQLAHREASMLAHADAFRFILVAFVIATLLVSPLLRNVLTTARVLADTLNV